MIYNIIGDQMKKTIVPFIFLISMSIILFVVFTKASGNLLTTNEAIKIGEDKYLKFLWMVDGAFNSKRFNEDYIVNGKELSSEDKIFTCEYKKNSHNECVGKNFQTEFVNLFSNKINYNNVYSDGGLYSIISNNEGEYTFNIIDNCAINRMDVNQQIRVVDIKNNEIVFEVNSVNNTNIENKKDFILVFDDNEWKISKAYYHDLCGTKFHIG